MAYWLRTHGLSMADLTAELRRGDGQRHEWTSIDRKHWQAGSPIPGEPPEVTDEREGTGRGCPTGMVSVRGAFRSELHGAATGQVERLQDAACTDWISREFPARCRTFDSDKIAIEVAKLPTQQMDYCIDRFEYPNVLGQSPMIVVTFREAETLCKKASKRLCTEDEWTFACEGEEVRPYPYGWTRDPDACVIDRPWRPFAEGALQPRDGANAREELDRLWQGEPSGSRRGCRSPFGVYDMTGNVDEWTRSVNTKGYASILKGGYWGPVRARCRPATRAHNEDFVAYQQSFRCCAESNRALPPPSVAALDASAPVASVLSGDAEAPHSDAGVEWPDSEDDDEIEAITKTRSALCSASPGANARTNANSGAAAVFVMAALIGFRRSVRFSTRRRVPSRGPAC